MAKGGQFEREIAKQLSLWWSKGRRDDIFWRTSNSGGRASIRHKNSKSTDGQYGDLCASDPLGLPLIRLLTFELKRGYSKSNPFDLLDRPPHAKLQTWEQWIVKAERDCERSGSVTWMIIARRDKREAVVMLPNLHKASINVLQSDPYPFVNAWVNVHSDDKTCRRLPVQIMLLSDWLDHAQPENLIRLEKGY